MPQLYKGRRHQCGVEMLPAPHLHVPYTLKNENHASGKMPTETLHLRGSCRNCGIKSSRQWSIWMQRLLGKCLFVCHRPGLQKQCGTQERLLGQRSQKKTYRLFIQGLLNDSEKEFALQFTTTTSVLSPQTLRMSSKEKPLRHSKERSAKLCGI